MKLQTNASNNYSLLSINSHTQKSSHSIRLCQPVTILLSYQTDQVNMFHFLISKIFFVHFFFCSLIKQQSIVSCVCVSVSISRDLFYKKWPINYHLSYYYYYLINANYYCKETIEKREKCQKNRIEKKKVKRRTEKKKKEKSVEYSWKKNEENIWMVKTIKIC